MSAPVTDVAVVGAGCSGLAVLKALREQGITAECFERGCEVGGLWGYANENGSSGAYASLRTNVSRLRMQYPSFAMPDSFRDFPHHGEMAAYLRAYADAFGLGALIRFGVSVERLEPAPNGTWRVALSDGSRRSFRAVVVATGPFSCPRFPTYPGSFAGDVDPFPRLPRPGAVRRSSRARGGCRPVGGGDRRRGLDGCRADAAVGSRRRARDPALDRPQALRRV